MTCHNSETQRYHHIVAVKQGFNGFIGPKIPYEEINRKAALLKFLEKNPSVAEEADYFLILNTSDNTVSKWTASRSTWKVAQVDD